MAFNFLLIENEIIFLHFEYTVTSYQGSIVAITHKQYSAYQILNQ